MPPRASKNKKTEQGPPRRDGLAFLGAVLVFFIITGAIGIGIGLFKRYQRSLKKPAIHKSVKTNDRLNNPPTK